MSEPHPTPDATERPAPADPPAVEYPALDPEVRPHPPINVVPKRPRPPQTIRNITYSIGLITLVVIALFLFTKIGGSPQISTDPVNVASQAKQVQAEVPFTVAVPTLSADYFSSSAEYSGGSEGQWSVYYAAAGGAINLVQATKLDDAFVTSAIGSTYEKSEVTVEGVQCVKARAAGSSTSASKSEVWSLRCAPEGSALLVSGNVPYANVEAVASAALASLAGK